MMEIYFVNYNIEKIVEHVDFLKQLYNLDSRKRITKKIDLNRGTELIPRVTSVDTQSIEVSISSSLS